MYSTPALVPRASYRSLGFFPATSNRSPEEEELLGPHQQLQVHGRGLLTTTQHSSFMYYRYPTNTTQENRPLLQSPLRSPQALRSQDTITLFSNNPVSLGASPSSLPWAENFDLLSSFPPEISVKILFYLHPEDLCR